MDWHPADDPFVVQVQTLQTSVDFSSGSYLLRLSLHMIGAAYDGRAFCIEIRTKESGA